MKINYSTAWRVDVCTCTITDEYKLNEKGAVCLQTQEETATERATKTQYLHGPRPWKRWYLDFESRFRIDFGERLSPATIFAELRTQ